MRLTQVAPVYTPPVLPAMCAIPSANQTAYRIFWTKVNLNTTVFDTTSDFDTVNHKWVCSEDGIYLVTMQVNLQIIADGVAGYAVARLNGVLSSPLYNILPGCSSAVYIAATALKQLSVDDYIELYVYHNDTVNRTLMGGQVFKTYLAIHKLS